MSNRYVGSIGVLALLWASTTHVDAAAKEQRQIAWKGLAAVVGHRVKIVMPDGARVEGKALSVEVDALAVDIGTTSNPSIYPKGKFLVPRATLKTVDVSHPTKKWRVLCTSVGGALGLFLGVEAALKVSESEPYYGASRNRENQAFVAVAIATPILGYLIGTAADRRTITYVIAQ